jgi:3-phenylpropionate/cinnamic acid dioxygenase small subunit
MPDARRLPDVLVLLAEIDDDEEFRRWSEQLDEIVRLPVTRSRHRALRRRHAAASDSDSVGEDPNPPLA